MSREVVAIVDDEPIITDDDGVLTTEMVEWLMSRGALRTLPGTPILVKEGREDD